jgi:heme o synthase
VGAVHAVVFLWTPPHFWALAIMYERDYTSAEVPMLPSVRGAPSAARASLRYGVATVAASLALPFADDGVGLVYVVTAVVLGAGLVTRSVQLVRQPDIRRAQRLFHFSISYLAALFIVVAVDQFVRWPFA